MHGFSNTVKLTAAIYLGFMSMHKVLNCHTHESGYPEILDSRLHGNDRFL